MVIYNKDQFPKIEVEHRDEADSRTLIGLLQWMPCLFFFNVCQCHEWNINLVPSPRGIRYNTNNA